MRRTLAAVLPAAALPAAVLATPAIAAAPNPFFESPSRNIGCVIIDATARCDIGVRSWSPPKRPSTCPHIVDFGQGIELARRGPARFVCAGDTAMEPHAPVLAYGREITRQGLRCSSATTGITCRSTLSGHGFFISRQSYRLF